MDNKQIATKTIKQQAAKHPVESGFGKGRFFSGKRKKNSDTPTCKTNCSGNCK